MFSRWAEPIFFFLVRIDTRDLFMVVTTFLIDILVVSMIYDVPRSLQKELNYQFSPIVVNVRVPHFCSCSKEGLF